MHYQIRTCAISIYYCTDRALKLIWDDKLMSSRGGRKRGPSHAMPRHVSEGASQPVNSLSISQVVARFKAPLQLSDDGRTDGRSENRKSNRLEGGRGNKEGKWISTNPERSSSALVGRSFQ